MFSSRTKARVASWHKWMGLILTVPLLGWIISAIAMMLITMEIPNGLQGVYRLQPYNSVDIRLDEAVITPTALLTRLSSEHGLERVHWMRLESRGPHLWYVVRPTPFSLAMTFDARTGQRLDPLSDELLALTANEALVGTRFAKLEPVPEFNRDYEIDRVPAVEATMVGEQPSKLFLSRDEGRTLRREDAEASAFHFWYKKFHVTQFTDDVIPWTAILYTFALGVVGLAILGYFMFWWRRKRPVGVAPSRAGVFAARNLHRKVGIVVGGVLIIQLIAGIYIWLSLGPLNDPFRGKQSFTTEWSAGIPTRHQLANPSEVLSKVSGTLPAGPRPIQAIEWRRLGDKDAWFITPRQDERPIVFDAETGQRIDALHPDVAGEIARQETVGHPGFAYLGPMHFESMDLNRRLPAYRFRFDDENKTDVYVLQNTGEIVMRRPAFWRLFGPFLAVHMLALTRNKVVDMTLFALFQLGFLVMIATGWRLQFPGKRAKAAAEREKSGVDTLSAQTNADADAAVIFK
jgi:uncharacterized iron-regulated membrane protein